ncbi:UNVERIFIED_CONTAM: hypothetical protein Sradi_3876600, partial [Sesamum radiatum]
VAADLIIGFARLTSSLVLLAVRFGRFFFSLVVFSSSLSPCFLWCAFTFGRVYRVLSLFPYPCSFRLLQLAMASDLVRLGAALTLMEEEDSGWVLPTGIWHADTSSPGFFVVGRLLASKTFNPDALVIERCPWAYNKNLLILAPMEAEDNPCTINLDWCEFHIHIHGLPLGKMTPEVCSFIGNKLGHFKELEMDANGQIWGSSDGFVDPGENPPFRPWLRDQVLSSNRVRSTGMGNGGTSLPRWLVFSSVNPLQSDTDCLRSRRGPSVFANVPPIPAPPDPSSPIHSVRTKKTHAKPKQTAPPKQPLSQKRKLLDENSDDELSPPCAKRSHQSQVALMDVTNFPAGAATNKSGGLVLLWDKTTDVVIQSFSPNHIDTSVRTKEDKEWWRFSRIYGESDNNREKGGPPRPQWQIRNFRAALTDCDLVDIGFHGDPFTWSNRHSFPGTVYERLDRACANLEWSRLTTLAGYLGMVNLGGSRPSGYNCPNVKRRIITLSQYAFVPGRLISDNILLGFELNHFLNTKSKGRQGYMVLKLDVSKAYDKRAEVDGHIRGVSICRQAPSISHLLFVDDTLIFRCASQADSRTILAVLDIYRHASGQEINLLKSSVGFSRNTPREVRLQLAADLNIRVENRMELYLGLPSKVARSKRDLLPRSRTGLNSKLSGTGKFTVRSAYHLTCELSNRPCSSDLLAVEHGWWRKLWQAKIPNKIKVFTWKACLNALPTSVNLVRRIQGFLAGLATFSSASIPQGPSDCFQWIRLMADTLSTADFGLFLELCWMIWWCRNQKLFRGECLTPNQAVCFARQYIDSYLLQNSDAPSFFPSGVLVRWQPPFPGTIKLNFDGTVLIGGLRTGVGVVARDHWGACLGWVSVHLSRSSPAELAEALTAREANLLAHRLGWSSVVLEGDYASLICKLASASHDLSAVGLIVFHILAFARSFLCCDFLFVRRECNSVAHRLARSGFGSSEWYYVTGCCNLPHFYGLWF